MPIRQVLVVAFAAGIVIFFLVRAGVDLARIPVLVVLSFAVYLGWSYYRGRSGHVPLYAVSTTVAGALVGGVIVQAFRLGGAVEVLNLAAIAFSVAALASHPRLWEEQIGADLQRTHLYQRLRLADVWSWQAWLKLVDRFGAGGAALAYAGVFVVAVGAAALSLSSTVSRSELAVTLLPLGLPALFGILSTLWIYRGARRLVPDA
ncbi:MAG: hypothetical protein GEU73_13830 [Chloroflexi bacterium]|nr:hypothetical protein [Chloroflexota bacterium]